jgi:hypothetical protein
MADPVVATGTHVVVGIDSTGAKQFLKVDGSGVLQTNAFSGSLPAGTNNIGKVDVNSLPAIPAGSNAIGSVSVTGLPAIPAGSNAIGTVGVTSLPAIPAGSNAIGSVSVTSLPAIPAGTNSIGTVTAVGAVAVGSPPTNPPVTVAGVDGSGNKQYIKTDTSGIVQSALNDMLAFSGSISAGGVITYSSPGPASGAIDTSGYGVVVVQLTGTWSGTVTFQDSNDNTNWVSATGVSSTGSLSSITTSNGIFRVSPGGRYVRVNVTSYSSGTVNASVVVRASPSTFPNISAFQGSAGATPWLVQAKGTTSGGLTKSRVQSAATTNATSVKASAGQVYFVEVGNNGASDAWIKFFDKASAPTVGTDTPVWTCYIPKGMGRFTNTDIGLVFSTGIAYAVTGGAGDSDTTAVAAAQVTGVIGYT